MHPCFALLAFLFLRHVGLGGLQNCRDARQPKSLVCHPPIEHLKPSWPTIAWQWHLQKSSTYFSIRRTNMCCWTMQMLCVCVAPNECLCMAMSVSFPPLRQHLILMSICFPIASFPCFLFVVLPLKNDCW